MLILPTSCPHDHLRMLLAPALKTDVFIDLSDQDYVKHLDVLMLLCVADNAAYAV